MGAEGEWQAAEQSILRLITTDSKKLKRECSFAFPNYGSFRLYRVNCKNYGVAVCCYNGQRYTTATIRTIKDVEDIIDYTNGLIIRTLFILCN